MVPVEPVAPAGRVVRAGQEAPVVLVVPVELAVPVGQVALAVPVEPVHRVEPAAPVVLRLRVALERVRRRVRVVLRPEGKRLRLRRLRHRV